MNTMMFSVIRGVMIRSLPYPGSNRLVTVQAAGGGVTMAEFQKCQDVSENIFTSLAAYRSGGDSHLVSGSGQAWVNQLMVTEGFLHTLGMGPLLGREFTASETHPGAPGAIILSEAIWHNFFASDPAIIGDMVTIDDKTYEIVGVLPSHFWFPVSFDVLTPLQSSGNLSDLGAETEVVARLRDGIAFGSARQEISLRVAVAGTTGISSGKRTEPRKINIVSLQDSLVADRRPILLLLFGATSLVLVMSCANLATLLLVYLASREKENAVRLALGSSRWHLTVQSSVEIFLIVSLGVGCGWGMAYSLLKLFLAKLPFHLPAATTVSMDFGVFAFAVVTVVMVASLLSLLSVLRAGESNISGLLNIMGRTTGVGSSRSKLRKSMVVTQVALSTVLLVVTGLAIRSLYNLREQHLGFQPEGIFTFETPFAPTRSRDPEAVARFVDSVKRGMEGLPGVHSISAITVLPLSGRMNLPAQRDGHPDLSIGGMEIRVVVPNYFDVMGIPLLEGRAFSNADLDTSPRVIIVNDTLKQKWWQDSIPLRDRVVIGRLKGRDIFKDVSREVVGVVGDTKTVNIQDPPRPTLYLPLTQADALGIRKLVWIVKGDTTLLGEPEVRRVIDSVDNSQRIQKPSTMNEIVASTTVDARFNALLFGIFAGVSLSLAVIGLYGLLSYIVASQSKEIALRLALGASRATVISSFVRKGLALTATGVALGIGVSLVAGRSMASILYGVTSTNMVNLLSVSALFLLVGLLAILLPSYRITRVDPAGLLRTD